MDATEHLLRVADDWRPRRVDLATVNDRRFTFSSGLGLDASVVERVDSHPRLKARLGEYYFTWAAVTTFTRRYLVRAPRLLLEVDGRELSGVTAVVQNGEPYTYFNRRPIEIAHGVALDDGALAGAVLERANPLDMPTVIWRAFSRRALLTHHRRIESFGPVGSLRVRSADGRPLPLQVDGDYIGEVEGAEYAIEPGALTVVA